MQVTFFCGTHIQCANSTNPMVLQAAKYNLEKRYSVVGITEHLNISVEVLEAYLPVYFSGATSLYKQFLPALTKNQNPHPLPSEEISNIMKDRLKMDIEFYHFAKQ